jgi:hypothetical protein
VKNVYPFANHYFEARGRDIETAQKLGIKTVHVR